MMAALVPLWKTPLNCPVDPLTLSPLLASRSQSQQRRGEELEDTEHLIGDVLTDWMTEKVDFSSYLPTSHSSPRESLPPSPPQHDVQVPSDLEVMTSLLQEELAQLEDYFLSDATPKKVEKVEKCDHVTPESGTQSYYPLPYASYSSSQSESTPLLVTLATGELDLLSFCGGPIGRCKTPRPAPYNCTRPNSNNRRRVLDGVRVADGLENNIWNSKENHSGSPEEGVNYLGVEAEKGVGKGCCVGNRVKIGECSVQLKEEDCYYFPGDVGGEEKMAGGYCLGAIMDTPCKREDQLGHGLREVTGSEGGAELETSQGDRCSGGAEVLSRGVEVTQSFLQSSSSVEPYHGFMGLTGGQMRSGATETGCRPSGFSDLLRDSSPECLPKGDGKGLLPGQASHRSAPELKVEPCTIKLEIEAAPANPNQGERKQKKRDQNKTAAHRYRQRKRAELDSLEEELHGLEVLNRELRDKAESVEREIQYVKDLLIEVYKARSQRLKQDTALHMTCLLVAEGKS
uniref:Activating transcription factor 5b n=1 Tax=Paramormyrops kingsleyae TaxID=1676925 RepID=A0A3B3Q756_9TELE